MSFIARERDRISAAIRRTPQADPAYHDLHIAQQALAWALEPEGIKSVYDSIMGTAASSKDYPPSSDPAPSGYICDVPLATSL
jgi:hypothetical protein